MTSGAQRRAVGEFRRRQAEVGVVRFEVAAPGRDKELIRRLAKRLVEAGPEVEGVRAEVRWLLEGEPPPERGGIWRVSSASPLVGAGLDLSRDDGGGRDVEL